MLAHASAPDFAAAIAAGNYAATGPPQASLMERRASVAGTGNSRPLSPPVAASAIGLSSTISATTRAPSPPGAGVSQQQQQTNGPTPVTPPLTSTPAGVASMQSNGPTQPRPATPPPPRQQPPQLKVVLPSQVLATTTAAPAAQTIPVESTNGPAQPQLAAPVAAAASDAAAASEVAAVAQCSSAVAQQQPQTNGLGPQNFPAPSHQQEAPQAVVPLEDILASAAEVADDGVRPNLSKSRFSIIHVDETEAVHSSLSPSGSGSNSNCNTVSSSSSMLSKGSGGQETNQPLSLLHSCLDDQFQVMNANCKLFEQEETSSLSGTSTPGGPKSKFKVTTFVEAMPDDAVPGTCSRTQVVRLLSRV